jgi:hypothetical protein
MIDKKPKEKTGAHRKHLKAENHTSEQDIIRNVYVL